MAHYFFSDMIFLKSFSKFLSKVVPTLCASALRVLQRIISSKMSAQAKETPKKIMEMFLSQWHVYLPTEDWLLLLLQMMPLLKCICPSNTSEFVKSARLELYCLGSPRPWVCRDSHLKEKIVSLKTGGILQKVLCIFTALFSPFVLKSFFKGRGWVFNQKVGPSIWLLAHIQTTGQRTEECKHYRHP